MVTTTLWLKEADIPTLTAFSGDIDADKLKPHIYTAQKNDIKRILGLDLYTKIDTDYKADTLAGEYLTLYDEYILDMLVYFSCKNYMAFGSYKTSNAGVYKITSENGQLIDSKELGVLINRYREMAANVETEFYKYMKTINIPEWTETTDNDSNKVIPWY
jgi:hypothetical protein